MSWNSTSQKNYHNTIKTNYFSMQVLRYCKLHRLRTKYVNVTFLGYGVCLWKYQSVFLLRIKNSQQVFLIFGIVIFKCRSFFAAKPNCWTSGNRQKRHLDIKYHQFPLPFLYNECFKFDLRFGCIWTLFSFNCIVNHFAAFLRWMVHIKSFVWLFAIA